MTKRFLYDSYISPPDKRLKINQTSALAEDFEKLQYAAANEGSGQFQFATNAGCANTSMTGTGSLHPFAQNSNPYESGNLHHYNASTTPFNSLDSNAFVSNSGRETQTRTWVNGVVEIHEGQGCSFQAVTLPPPRPSLQHINPSHRSNGMP